MGLQSIAVDEPGALGGAWDAALSADRPTLLDVRCDPEVPPIPPHATYEQLKDLATSVLKGDPNGWHLVVQGAKTKAQEFVPHRGT
jgi:pyruvate dehydrogenase (quinone)